MLMSGADLCAQGNDSLKIESNYEVGQIEVGGPFVGIEIHKSFPMINRISFYYPVANSIDISEDYWKRENYRIMSMGLKVGDDPKLILKKEPWTVIQTPYDVGFQKDISESAISIKYQFCMNRPAMSAEFIIENKSNATKVYEVYLRYETVLRTSQTYALIDSGISKIDNSGSLIYIDYDTVETGRAQVFYKNVGEQPYYSAASFKMGKSKTLDDFWLHNDVTLQQENINSTPEVIFVYRKELQPGECLDIIQLIGSVKISEAKSVIADLTGSYKNEILNYKNYILNNSIGKKVIKTGNQIIDFTTDWALAVLGTNAHFIDSDIVPMPAQAEYNFYFTHDALLTDLAAVNFDLDRVKNDLKFILKHSDENKVIPHAYYWKDDKYKTEYAGTENWNHVWFTILAARYLRHSGDLEFAKILYPYVKKSIDTALKNKENNLMYSFRPDWWDIGNNYGPRAYMTILAIKALREFSFFSAELNKDQTEIQNYNSIADTLHKYLLSKLWNEDLKYLTSFFEDGSEDKHIYMGSMLASHFGLLDEVKNAQLMSTAKENLLDEKLGIYTLFPMDLHKLGDYMGFAGNEAGEPYYYANGGIWPHGNAWYVLGLISNNSNEEAYEFVKKIMTLDGVINSPNGQPAMYEYRVSDKENPKFYGKIDKPQFLWAGGWYLYTLYNLYGIRENEWNISVDPFLPEDTDSVNLNLTLDGRLIPVSIKGKGKYISSLTYNGKSAPSSIIPEIEEEEAKEIVIELGSLTTPMITKVNSKISEPVYLASSKTLSFETKSFKGNNVVIHLVSPMPLKSIIIGDEENIAFNVRVLEDRVQKIEFGFTQKENGNKIKINFN